MPENQVSSSINNLFHQSQPGLRRSFSYLVLLVFWGVSLSACAQPTAQTLPPSTSTFPPEVTRTETPHPSKTPSPAPSHTPRPTSTEILLPIVCSPLEGVEIKDLAGIIAGDTYDPPQPGRDDGHAGVDFAYYRRGTRTTMLGLPVKSAMTGKVAAIVNNRKPYGNMVMIETPIDITTQRLPFIPLLPTTAPTVRPDPRLTCPNGPGIQPASNSQRSIYTLYAHLQNPPRLLVGEKVGCGQVIGEVGTSGNSVNPHLHFETRIGPSGISFDSLGHYDPSMTELERSNYCIWRVSGWFQLFDPMLLLSMRP